MVAAREGAECASMSARPRVDVGDALRVRRRLRLGEQAGALGVGRQHPVDQGGVVARRLLLHVADARALRRDVTEPSSGADLAGDQPQQRRLAGAVAADEADLVTGRQRRRRRIEDEPPLDAVGEIVDMQHGFQLPLPFARQRRGEGRGEGPPLARIEFDQRARLPDKVAPALANPSASVTRTAVKCFRHVVHRPCTTGITLELCRLPA